MPIDFLLTTVRSAMWSWYDTKHFIEQSVAFSSDSIHVVTGVIIQLVAGLLLKKPISRWGPWLVVIALIFLNEFIDLQFDHWPLRSIQYGESTRDLILTMALPTILLLATRSLPRLFQPPCPQSGCDAP
jgi:hypothetical protein